MQPARLGPIFAVAIERTDAGHLHVTLPPAKES
jgi:hypothetical protein